MALKCTEAWGMLVCVIQCNMIIVSNLILDENCTATVLNCVFISDAYIYAFYIKWNVHNSCVWIKSNKDILLSCNGLVQLKEGVEKQEKYKLQFFVINRFVPCFCLHRLCIGKNHLIQSIYSISKLFMKIFNSKQFLVFVTPHFVINYIFAQALFT